MYTIVDVESKNIFFGARVARDGEDTRDIMSYNIACVFIVIVKHILTG